MNADPLRDITEEDVRGIRGAERAEPSVDESRYGLLRPAHASYSWVT